MSYVSTSSYAAASHACKIMNACISTDEYRVKVERNYDGHTPYGDYVLKVENENIRIFTSNGKLPTKFSCPIKDIYEIKYYDYWSLILCNELLQEVVH